MLFSDKSPIGIHDGICGFNVDFFFNLSSQSSGYSEVKTLILSNIDTFIGLLISQSEQFLATGRMPMPALNLTFLVWSRSYK